MKVTVEVRKAEVEEAVGKKSGKPYAMQTVGVLLPGEDFAVPHKMFIDRAETGQFLARPVGLYTANAELKNVSGDLVLSVDYRTLRAKMEGPAKPVLGDKKAA